MAIKEKKRSFFAKIRNYFIAGVVVLIPIGMTIYLTIFLMSISSKIIPKEINQNHYLPYDVPGVEILIAIFLTILEYLDNIFIDDNISLPIFSSLLIYIFLI